MAYHQMQTQAERDVRGAMLLEKIAEAENVEVSKEEIEEEIGKLADYYRTTPDEIRSSLEKQGGGSSIENNLRTRKSIEALISKAKIVDGEWIDESAEAQQAVEAASGEEKPKKAAKKKAPAKKTAKASGTEGE
jgi:FKBP-type peptidyl-prolyl cis-trans isomerase (trigger factor)